MEKRAPTMHIASRSVGLADPLAYDLRNATGLMKL